ARGRFKEKPILLAAAEGASGVNQRRRSYLSNMRRQKRLAATRQGSAFLQHLETAPDSRFRIRVWEREWERPGMERTQGQPAMPTPFPNRPRQMAQRQMVLPQLVLHPFLR